MKIIITEEQLNKLILNEIRIIDNNVKKLNYTPFILHKGIMTLFNAEDSEIFIQQIYNYIEENNIGLHLPETYGDANNIIEFGYNKNPQYITGYFHYDNGNLVINFYENTYLNIQISDEVKKLLEFKAIEYFNFLGQGKYSRDELIKNFNKVYNKEIKLTNYLYHGTNSNNLMSILKKGLSPQKNYTNFNGVNHLKHIFLTTSYNDAKEYASVASYKNLKSKRCIIKIDTNKIDKNKITFDYDFYSRYIGKGNEDYDKINAEKKTLAKQTLSNKSHQNPGNKFKKIGYHGIIYPGAIVSIFIEDEYERFSEITPKEFIEKYTKHN